MDKAPPEDSVILNVCVIPSAEVGKQCVELSQSLKSESTLFVLDGISKFAHMTIFMARFPNAKMADVVDAAREVASQSRSFRCEHTGYFITADRYLEASYRRVKEFDELREHFITDLKEHRINPENPFEESYFAPYTSDQQKNACETGYDLSRHLYRPHITLTRYREGQQPSAFPGLAPAALSFPLATIGVYKADDNGAVYEKLAEFTV